MGPQNLDTRAPVAEHNQRTKHAHQTHQAIGIKWGLSALVLRMSGATMKKIQNNTCIKSPSHGLGSLSTDSLCVVVVVHPVFFAWPRRRTF